MPGATFSEVWYQIAQERVALLPSVVVTRQYYRGQLWFVLEDPNSMRFFRLSPQAFAFLQSLDGDLTVEQAWARMIEHQPALVPGQDEVVRLLSQLHVANLLLFRSQPQNEAIYQRSRLTGRREVYGKLLSFLFLRIPLWDPDAWLNRIAPLIRRLVGPTGMVTWLLVVLAGAVSVLDQGDALLAASHGLLAIGNLPWLYLSLSAPKLLHELAHAFVCKRYGGQVHTFGVMFLILTPLPYMDATTSWSFSSKWQRALVGAAGILMELFLAALAAMVWVNTGPGLVHTLAFNIMVVSSISSLLFNGNPLVRFDAYYILADLLEMPNLYQRAQQQWLYFGSRYLLGHEAAIAPAADRTEWWWLTGYGAVSFLYRLLVTAGILLYVLDLSFALGAVLALTIVITLIIMPGRKLLAHLASPALRPTRARAWGQLAALLLAVYAALVWLPVPYAVRAPGIVESGKTDILFAQTPGRLVSIQARHGQALRQGDTIATLNNPELGFELQALQMELRESQALYRQALAGAVADLLPIARRIAALEQRQAELQRLLSHLVLRASQDGELVAPLLNERLDTWIERGSVVGEVVGSAEFRFAAVVSQEEAEELFSADMQQASIRLVGQVDHPIASSGLSLIPFQRQRLASASLGMLGGGDVAVRADDQSGTATTEGYYALHAELQAAQLTELAVYRGLSGVLRIALPGRPLYWQLRKAIMQLAQNRYGV